MIIRQGDFQTVSNRVLNIDVEGIASGIYSLSVVEVKSCAVGRVVFKVIPLKFRGC